MNSGLAIVWSGKKQRSHEFACELGMKTLSLRGAAGKKLSLKVLQYFINFFRTIYVIEKLKPSYLFIQVPPWILLWAVCIATRRVPIFVDAHPSAFGHFDNRVSKYLLELTPVKWLKRPKAYLVANSSDSETIQTFNTRSIIFGEIILNDFGDRLGDNQSVLVPWTFDIDDPVKELATFLESYCGEFEFRLTGHLTPGNRELYSRFSNVKLLGYLTENELRTEMRNSSVVLAVSKSKETRMRVAIEATLCKVPVITCDNANMLEELPNAIHVSPDLLQLGIALEKAAEIVDNILEDSAAQLIEKNRKRLTELKSLIQESLMKKETTR